MATQRYVSTSFWDDPWITELEPEEKYLYLYFLTNPLTNIAGVYQIAMKRIIFDTGLPMDRVSKAIDRFSKAMKAYYINGYIILPKWPKHQKWHDHKKIEAGIVAILKELPQELLGFLQKIGYAYPIDSLSIPYTYPKKPYVYPSNYSDTDINTDSDIDLNSDINNSVQKSKTDPETEPGPEETPPAELSAPSEKNVFATASKESKLYTSVKTIFEEEQLQHRFTNYPKEGKAIKQLIKKAKARSPDDPETFLLGMIEQFRELRESGDKFWKGQPFLPSALNSAGIFDRVLNEAHQRWKEKQPVSDFNIEEVVF